MKHPRLALSAILTATALACWTSAGADTGYAWLLPPGVAPPPVPADNPMSAAKVELGRRLFYDADLSVDGTVACSTCHEQKHAFTEGNATHPGVKDNRGRRNVMGLANIAYFAPLTWADPWRIQLEDQVAVPVMGKTPVEMGMAGQAGVLAERLRTDDCYRQMFLAAFPEANGAIGMPTIAKAIAAFERTLLSFDSPYDRAGRGDSSAMSPQAKRGQALFFEKYDCASCHAGPNFTDAAKDRLMNNGAFHNIGLYDQDRAGGYPERDHGLKDITGWMDDEGKVRTPTLRNIELTGPYMHDGQVRTLEGAIHRHYGAPANPLRDPRLAGKPPTPDDTADLVAFLDSLTDRTFIADPRFSLPKTACGKRL